MKIQVLIFSLLIATVACHPGNEKNRDQGSFRFASGAIVRGDTLERKLALVFTGDTYAEGGEFLQQLLENHRIKGSFFLTGKFYRNPEFGSLIQVLVKEGHYLGAHSDQHLLYCDWEIRDSLLVSKEEFRTDLEANYQVMAGFGIRKKDAPFFLPPYEWYNDTIARWTSEMGLTLINMSRGTLSHTDYTLPGTDGYRSSKEIFDSILEYEHASPTGLNGFILLSHIGSSPRRTDKFYLLLDDLITALKNRGYSFLRIDELLITPSP
jgi:peptidoglycan/xylan/chitin deacetylase (PgdA/CDA1 family)